MSGLDKTQFLHLFTAPLETIMETPSFLFFFCMYVYVCFVWRFFFYFSYFKVRANGIKWMESKRFFTPSVEMFWRIRKLLPTSPEGCHFPHIAAVLLTFPRNQTHFLASAFSNLATRSEVAHLLCVRLLPFRSWQGLPWAAQRGHLPPTAICAQVFLIPPSLSTFPSWFLPFSLSGFYNFSIRRKMYGAWTDTRIFFLRHKCQRWRSTSCVTFKRKRHFTKASFTRVPVI